MLAVHGIKIMESSAKEIVIIDDNENLWSFYYSQFQGIRLRDGIVEIEFQGAIMDHRFVIASKQQIGENHGQ